MGRACPTCATPLEQLRCPGCQRLIGSPCNLGCTRAAVAYEALEQEGGEEVEVESAEPTELDLGRVLDDALAEFEAR